MMLKKGLGYLRRQVGQGFRLTYRRHEAEPGQKQGGEALKTVAAQNQDQGLVTESEQRQIDHSLRESEARYRSIIEDQEELIRRFTPDGTLTFVNRAFCRYFNKTADELLGLNFIQLIPTEDHDTVREQMLMLTPAEPVAQAERRFISIDGTVRWQQWINRAIFDEASQIIEYQSVGRDITAKKQVEQKLQESEARYRAIIEDQEELIRRFRPDYTLTFVNSAFCRYFGQTAENLLGQSFMKLIPCEDHELVRCQIEALNPDNAVAVAERRFTLANGEVWWQQWVNRAIFDHNGCIVEYQSVGRDITSQKKVERQLKESEARYRAIVEDQEELIRRFTPDGTLTFVNRAFCRYFDKSPEDLLGLNFIHLIPPEDHKMVWLQIARLTPADPVAQAERRFIGPDGKVRWQHWINRAIFDEAGQIIEYQSVGRDITSQKEAEIKISEAREAIARATRVTTLAIIGGGIAHEINQPLNAIRVLAETGLHLCRTNAAMSKVVQCIRDVSGQVDRIDSIVNHLRSFLRTTQMVEYVPCHLNDVVESSLSYVSNQLFVQHIKVKKELALGLPPVNGSFVRFEEVVLNLLMNAMQALEGRDGQVKEIIIRTWADEDVHLTVSDNGPGIAPEICGKIFEPFFSTKKLGDSMGLGLSIVEVIVASCNGSIKAENNTGGGTLIQVSLPGIPNV